MVFSSPIFICVFLPLVLGLYYLLPKATNNAVLVAASKGHLLIIGDSFAPLIAPFLARYFPEVTAIERVYGRLLSTAR